MSGPSDVERVEVGSLYILAVCLGMQNAVTVSGASPSIRSIYSAEALNQPFWITCSLQELAERIICLLMYIFSKS